MFSVFTVFRASEEMPIDARDPLDIPELKMIIVFETSHKKFEVLRWAKL